MTPTEISNLIESYILNPHPQHAILLNGSWGSGKTYFWKTTLIPLLEKHNKKGLYISLNGINSIGDLEYKVFIEMVPYLAKNPILKNATQLLSNTANIVTKYVTRSNVTDLLKGFSVQNFSFEKHVLCFDDLERCLLPIEQISGYLNAFVEHSQAKMLILADESKMRNRDQFYEIREKFISRVLKFTVESNYALGLLIPEYKNDKAFLAYLNTYRSDITSWLEDYEVTNLRTVNFFLHSLHEIYKALSALERPDEVDRKIIFFTLIIVLEFKSGELSSDLIKAQELKKIGDPLFMITAREKRIGKASAILANRAGKDEELDYPTQFYNRYILEFERNDLYYFYLPICQCVLTGLMDEKFLRKEVKDSLPQSQLIKDQQFEKLMNYRFRELENEVFADYSKSVWEYALNGEYSLYQYATLLKFFLYFSEKRLIDLNSTEVSEGLYNGLNIAAEQSTIDHDQLENLLHFPDENEEVETIKQEISRLHYKGLDRDLMELGKEFIKSLHTTDTLEGLKELFTFFFKKQGGEFRHLDIHKLLETFQKASNKKLSNLLLALEQHFKRTIFESSISDYGPLKELTTLLINHLGEKELDQPKAFLLQSITEFLNTVITRYDKIIKAKKEE